MSAPESTEGILAALDSLAAGRLERRGDLAVLLQATAGEHRPLLDELGFHAKFLVRARGIMERIGRDGEGYDRLAAEFAVSLGKVRDLLGRIIGLAPEGIGRDLSGRYLAMTPGALGELMALCSDLRWYKNLLIDRGSVRTG